MAISKSIQFLNLHSDFWLTFYEDAHLIDRAMSAVAESIKSLYFRFLQKEIPLAVSDMPVFQEQYWNLIELEADSMVTVTRDSIDYYSYPLDEAYGHIPLLYNILYMPTVVMAERLDYLIEREVNNDGLGTAISTTSTILFKKRTKVGTNPFNGDPFTNNDIARRMTDTNKLVIALWAPKVYIDSNDLYNEYGSLLKIIQPSSEEYKAFLTGLLRLYIKGPSIGSLNAGINLAAGYPVARMTETIVTVEIYINAAYDINEFRLVSDHNNEYVIPRKIIDEFDDTLTTPAIIQIAYPRLKLSGVNGNEDFSDPTLVAKTYKVSWDVDRLDTFLTDLRIVDNRTEAKWWRKQLGKISSNMVRGLNPGVDPDQPPSPIYPDMSLDKDLQEYLFNRYLQYNTFGVFIDFRVLRKEFKVMGDFLAILNDVKPSWKAFIVYEDDLKVITIVKAGDTFHTTRPDPNDPNYNPYSDPFNPLYDPNHPLYDPTKDPTNPLYNPTWPPIIDYTLGTTLSYAWGLEETNHINRTVNMGLPFYDTTITKITDFSQVQYSNFAGSDFDIRSALLAVHGTGFVPQVSGTQLQVMTEDPDSINHCSGVFFNRLLPVDSDFRVEFQYKTHVTNRVNRGLGFAFVIRNGNLDLSAEASYEGYVSPGSGGAPGYNGDYAQLAIEFDMRPDVDLNDPPAAHIAVMGKTGNNLVTPDHDLYELAVNSYIPALEGQHNIRIDYIDGVLTVYMDQYHTPVLSLAIDLSLYVPLNSGQAILGFTGANLNTSQFNRMDLFINSLVYYNPIPNGLERYGAAPVRLGMAIETIVAAYSITALTVTIRGDATGGPSSEYYIGRGGPLTIGMGTAVPDTPIAMGCGPNERLFEYTRLVVTVQPLLEIPVVNLAYPFVTLTWDDTGADHYMVFRDLMPLAITAINTFDDTTLETSGTYAYEVLSITKGRPSILSNSEEAIVTVVQDAPVAQAATIIQADRFTANWNAAADAIDYLFDLSTDNFNTYISIFHNYPVAGLSLTIAGLLANTEYKYRLRGRNGFILSGYSNVITATTELHTPQLNAPGSIGSISFVLNWLAVPGANTYLLDISEVADFSSFYGPYNNFDLGNVLTYEVAGLIQNTYYYYRLQAVS